VRWIECRQQGPVGLTAMLRNRLLTPGVAERRNPEFALVLLVRSCS
jgi:hypothetical protein